MESGDCGTAMGDAPNVMSSNVPLRVVLNGYITTKKGVAARMSISAVSVVLAVAGAPIDVQAFKASSTPVVSIYATPKPVPSALIASELLQSEPPAPLPASGIEKPMAERPAPPPQTTDQAHPHTDIVVTSRARNVPGDPLQELNFATFQVTQAVDQAVVRPAALAYSNIVPEPIRLGIRNFLDHIYQPVVFVNLLLQLKIGKAVETVARFAINSTLGVVGLLDMAKRKPFKMVHRVIGFADTMGFYGVKAGPFLFVPVIGPTTARDLIGTVLDRMLIPFVVGKPFNKPAFALPSTVFGELDQRDQFDEEMDALKGDGRGYYTATREDYLKRRQAHIDALRRK